MFASAPQPGMWLRWEALQYDVALPAASPLAACWPSADADAAAPPRTKRILYGVNGQLLPGALLAVVGPSGSGKTSLLRILAARREPTAGALLVDGAPLDVAAFRRASGFVPQLSVFLDTLTVRETLSMTALLRLDRSVPNAAKLARAEEVLAAVELTKCADSRIGNDVAGGISGGERRRLSIGVEVVHKPRLLLLDEPTSGLDATSAQMVGDTLRRMSDAHGTSSLATLHQPRVSLLALFDSLMLLASGRVAYFGPTGLAEGAPQGVLQFFAADGFTCPPMVNPADWLLDLVQCVTPAAKADGDDATLEATRLALAQGFAARYEASAEAAAAMAPPPAHAVAQPLALKVAADAPRFPTGWWTQFSILWRRTMLYKLREPSAVLTQASCAVVLPLLVGGIFWRIPLTQSAVPDRLACVSFLVLLQSFMCMDQILLFPKERAVYLRDHAAGLHSTGSFFAARTLAEMPFIILFAIISATISYWMFGFQPEASKFFTFVAVIAAVTEAGAALLTSLGALSPSMEVANILATLLIVVLTLLDGFYRRLDDVPPWCRWVAKLSFLGYGVQAVAANEFRGLTFTCTPEEALSGCVPTGDAFLLRLGMSDVHIGANIGYILVLAVGSRCVAYLSLRFLYTGQSLRERLAQP